MLTYMIIVNDNGELKTISQKEVDELEINLWHGYDVDSIINEVLDKRASAAVPVIPLTWIDCAALDGRRKLIAYDFFGNEFACRYYQGDTALAIEQFKKAQQAKYDWTINMNLKKQETSSD